MNLFAGLFAPGNVPLLVECARFFSPHWEELPESVIFDLTGLEKLFGPPQSIAEQIVARVGIPAQIALAGNPDSAAHAARGLSGITLIPPGQEQTILAPLSVNLLEAPPEIAEMLDQWGIRTFGELAALPPLGISARLGEEGIRLWSLARGEWRRLLNPQLDPVHYAASIELEYPVDLLEPLAFLLSRLLHEICDRLQRSSLAMSGIAVRLKLEDNAEHARTLRFPVPLVEPATLLKLLQLDLQNAPPLAPVVAIALEAEPTRPRIQQGGLFLPSSPEPEKLELTIARIAAFVGPDHAGSPELLDSHRPDAFRMVPFGSLQQTRSVAEPLPVRTALRRFRPPRQAHVQLREGKPARIASASLQGPVVSCSGPWRTAGDWWTEDGWDHDEWDVALSGGALLKIYQDRRNSRWFVEGTYD